MDGTAAGVRIQASVEGRQPCRSGRSAVETSRIQYPPGFLWADCLPEASNADRKPLPSGSPRAGAVCFR